MKRCNAICDQLVIVDTINTLHLSKKRGTKIPKLINNIFKNQKHSKILKFCVSAISAIIFIQAIDNLNCIASLGGANKEHFAAAQLCKILKVSAGNRFAELELDNSKA